MNVKKLRATIALYKKKFKEKGIEPTNYPHDSNLIRKSIGLSHCAGMLDEMLKQIKAKKIEKTMRWLGFIQGVLWMEGLYTLNELKEHNIDDVEIKKPSE